MKIMSPFDTLNTVSVPRRCRLKSRRVFRVHEVPRDGVPARSAGVSAERSLADQLGRRQRIVERGFPGRVGAGEGAAWSR